MKKSLILIMACGMIMWNVSFAHSAKKIVIKVAHNGSVTYPYHIGMEKFKEVLEMETKGAVEVQIFPNSQLGSEEECAQMIKAGTLDVNINSSGGLAGFVSEAEIFNLPFIFRDLQHFYRVIDGPVGKRTAIAIEEKLECVFLGYLYTGVRNLWTTKKPVRTLDDLKGLKIRVMSSPVFVETWNNLGAQATPMSFGELYSALQQGVVDGAEMDVYDLKVDKFYEVIKHVSFTQHQFLPSMATFSKKRYDRLPPYIQAAVLKAAQAMVSTERKTYNDLSNKGVDEMKAEGVSFYELDQKLFKDKILGVYKKYAEKVGGIELIEMVGSN